MNEYIPNNLPLAHDVETKATRRSFNRDKSYFFNKKEHKNIV